MKAKCVKLVILSLIVGVVLCQADRMGNGIKQILRSWRTTKVDEKSLIIKEFITAYQRELIMLRKKEEKIKTDNIVLDKEIISVRVDDINTVEAGMRSSFQEGIYSTLRKRNQRAIMDTKLEIIRLHVKYNTLIRDKGYDWTEFEQLMCDVDAREMGDSLCHNLGR